MGLAKAIKRGASALLIGSMMTGLFTGCSATGENSGGKLVKIAVCVSDQTPAAQALTDVFKPMVEEATDGRYDIQIYNSGVLGSEKVTYDYTKSGIVEMCVVGTTMWSETPKMTIPDFPFLFDSVEHARVCYQGELGEYIAEDLESTQPLKLLSWYPNGARVFTSNKKLESLDDFNGQKLRMPNNPIHVKLAESLGANVVIMDMGEVFTALEQGVADGQDNPLATVKTEGWYEVQDYVYDTNHIIASLELFAGEEFWNSLSEEDQEAFEKASEAASDYAWDLYEEQLSDDKQFMKDNGLIVNTVTQLTDNPNRVAVNINKANYSHHVIKKTGVMNVNCLSVEAPFEVFKTFGFQSGRLVDKFAGYQTLRSDNGLVFLPKYINAFMSLKVEQYVDLDTHGMFICTVTEARVMSDKETMTYTYYQKNVKPKPQTEGKKGFVCVVCGYIYEGDVLPDDFICPLCKHGVADFEPIS